MRAPPVSRPQPAEGAIRAKGRGAAREVSPEGASERDGARSAEMVSAEEAGPERSEGRTEPGARAAGGSASKAEPSPFRSDQDAA
jgi:hypothetical protein